MFSSEFFDKTRENTDRDEDINNRKYFSRISLRSDIAITNSRRGNHRKIETIEQSPSLNKVIKECPSHEYENRRNGLILKSESWFREMWSGK